MTGRSRYVHRTGKIKDKKDRNGYKKDRIWDLQDVTKDVPNKR